VFTVAGVPAVVPVSFAVRDGAVVLRTAAGTRLAAVAVGGLLTFEADDFDAAAGSGWSVVVTGTAELVTSPREQAVIRAAVQPLAPGHHDVYLRLPITELTGRRVELEPVDGRPTD
jgi:nitroimidazol reductase NimA-like FMN-containing flavoprotein (pyridoxamine 5'-phosphate oxidase superfamily)